MSSHRDAIEAFVGPGTEGLIGGHSRLLVRARLHDDGIEHPQPDVTCDLRPHDARELAFCMLATAEYADRLSDQRSATRNDTRHNQEQP